jgi:hypothetical protein
LGLRPHTVSIVLASTDGTHTGDGGRLETLTPLTHSDGSAPKVRWAKDQDVAMQLVTAGTVTIGPITSDFTGFEYLADLDGRNLDRGEVRLLRLTGPKHPEGADYRIESVKSERALHYLITACPAGTQA